ncbi:MAG: Amuc_1100 family pilus-like protein [Akkermansia sp.]|nr:Amuc_1100 family pilus-like protein [Akkermansia sp.]
MNFFENKRAATLTGVFALAFVGLMAWGYTKGSAAEATIKDLTTKENTLRSITASALPPKAETKSTLNKATKNIRSRVNMLTDDLKAYTKTCKVITADAISKELLFHPEHLNAARTWLNKKANGCEIPGGDAFTFGLDRNYNERNDAATTDTTPYLLYQLNAARTLAGYVAEAGAVSLDRMYCEPVPSEEEGTYTPLHIELSFTAKRGSIPSDTAHTGTVTKVINSILEGKGDIVLRQEEKEAGAYFFIIKGINVNSNNSYGALDSYSEPFQTAGSDNAEPVSIAQRKVGLDDETVRVNLIIEAVYFSQNAN